MEKKGKLVGSYELLSTLGTGSEAKVKLVMQNGQEFAAKIFYNAHNERRSQQKVLKEINVLKKLKQNPHIIQYVTDFPNADIIKKSGQTYKSDCIILEYCENGSLYEWIEGTGPFSENLARTLFSQLIESLEQMHTKSIYHNDLKPENILFQKEFILKITDFGMAKDCSDLEMGFIHTQVQNPTVYHAPEVNEQKSQNHAAIDIFAVGVILFIMLTGHFPFTEASINTSQDRHYHLIYNKEYQQFWELHSKNKGKKHFFSNDLKDLIQKMLEYSPDQRITLETIKKHPWYNQAILTPLEIEEEFNRRNQDFKNYRDEINYEKRYQKQSRKKIDKLSYNYDLIQPSFW